MLCHPLSPPPGFSALLKSLVTQWPASPVSVLELNPVALRSSDPDFAVPLDAACLSDAADATLVAASLVVAEAPPCNRPESRVEAAVRELDEKTGASLKLQVLNPDGCVWTLVAGGGASVAVTSSVTTANTRGTPLMPTPSLTPSWCWGRLSLPKRRMKQRISSSPGA
mmetsp:Transcript_60666/g.143405  ORF Transcript_60666/g.143405 Transcript_60666/m.143405 type:complete len:168 (-) Transcript_60666:177-680(-)